jgi:colanic acid/amylovoran biosynthesis protein
VILLITVCCFWFAHHIGKPVYLYAQSIGPFRSCFQEMIVRRALRKLQLVIVREEISLKLVSSWNLQCPVRMAADAAFLLPQPKPSDLTVRFPPHSCCVGITVRKWSRAAKAQEHFERAMVQFLDWITTSGETIVVLVPQVTVAAWDDDDRNVMRRLYAQSHMKNRVILVEDELSPLHVKALCGAMDFFVGTRMHSNIFALSMGVPTLAIGYQPKSAGIMQQLGLERWVIPWENVAFHRLKAAFEDLAVNAEEVRTALYQKLPDVIRKARLNSHWIAEISIAAGTKGAAPHG